MEAPSKPPLSENIACDRFRSGLYPYCRCRRFFVEVSQLSWVVCVQSDIHLVLVLPEGTSNRTSTAGMESISKMSLSAGYYWAHRFRGLVRAAGVQKSTDIDSPLLLDDRPAEMTSFTNICPSPEQYLLHGCHPVLMVLPFVCAVAATTTTTVLMVVCRSAGLEIAILARRCNPMKTQLSFEWYS